jgi:hypothetical protein
MSANKKFARLRPTNVIVGNVHFFADINRGLLISCTTSCIIHAQVSPVFWSAFFIDLESRFQQFGTEEEVSTS